MVLITLRSILDLCLLMLTGFAAFRFKIIKKEGLNTMNGVLLNIALPATMLKSFQMDLLFEKKELLVSALGLSLLCQLLSIALPFILIRKGPDRNVERSAVAFSNNAFIAIPLLTSIYGDIGTFYASALNVISILFVFSVQPLMISGKFSAKDVARKTLNNKVIITLAAVALLDQHPDRERGERIPHVESAEVVLRPHLRHLQHLGQPSQEIIHAHSISNLRDYGAEAVGSNTRAAIPALREFNLRARSVKFRRMGCVSMQNTRGSTSTSPNRLCPSAVGPSRFSADDSQLSHSTRGLQVRQDSPQRILTVLDSR